MRRSNFASHRDGFRFAVIALLLLTVVLCFAEAFAPPTKRIFTPSLTRHFLSQPPVKDETTKNTPSFADNSEPFFDPFELPESSVDRVNIELHVQEKTNEENAKLGIWAARGLLLLVAAIWGTNFASVKYLENLCFHPPCHHPPSEAAFARFGLAALVSLPLLLKQRWDVIRAGLECGLWIALGYASQAQALATIDSGKCAFICSLTVVFVPLMSSVVYGKPFKLTNILAAAVALAGVGVLEGMVDVNALLGISSAVAADTAELASGASSVVETASALASSSLETATSAIAEASTGPFTAIANIMGVSEGDILALGQPIGFGTAFTRIEHYQEEFKNVPNRVLTIAAAQCVAVGVLSFLWVLYDFNGVIPSFGYMLEPHRIAAIGWTGIVTTVVAIFIEGIALQTATATDAALTFSTEPVWASIFGFILLHETLGSNSYVGGTLILLACLIGAVSDLMSSEKDITTVDHEYHMQDKD